MQHHCISEDFMLPLQFITTDTPLKSFSIFLLFILLTNSSLGQTNPCDCHIKGTVRDKETGKALVGINVQLKGANKGMVSTSNGEFSFKGLCPGSYTLITSAVGYQASEQHFDLAKEHESNVLLEEADEHLQEVLVVGKQQTITSQSSSNVSGNALEQTRGNSLGESLKAITGVTTLQTGSSISKPVIHGMHSNRVLIMNNGIRQEGQQWGAEHAPEIDPFVAKKLTVVKGAAGVRYGSDAIGGVILVEPAKLPDSSRMTGEANLVGFSNGGQGILSGILQGGIKALSGFSWRVQGTIKKGGNIRAADYYLLNTGIEEQNFSLNAAYQKANAGVDVFFSQFNTTIGIFTGSHIGNVENLQEALSLSRPLAIYTPSSLSYTIDKPNQDLQHNLLKVKAFWNWDKLGKWHFTLGRQYNFRAEYDVQRGTKAYVQSFRLETYTGELLLEHRPLFQKITGSVGLTGIIQSNLSTGTDVRLPFSRTILIPNYESNTVGMFIIEKYAVGKFDFDAGLRADTRLLTTYRKADAPSEEILVRQHHNENVAGSLGGIYTFNDAFSVRLNISTAWRPPSINEWYSQGVHHGAASYEQGDLNLQPERALNTSLTFTYTTERLALELGIYHNRIANYIYLRPADSLVYTIRGAFPLFQYKQLDAIFQGIDFSGSYRLSKQLTFSSKLALLRAFQQGTQQFLYGIPSDRLENTLQWDFSKKEAYFSIGNQLVAQQTRIEPNADFAPAPAGYSLWNLQAGMRLPLGKSQSIKIGLSVTNLLNVSYREYMNRFRYFTDDMGRNIALRLTYEF